MALASTSPQLFVVATASGESDYIKLPPGEFLLEVESPGAYVAELKASASGNTFQNVLDNTGVNAIFDSTQTTNQQFVVVGNNRYLLNVTTYNSDITLKAYQVK